MPPIPAKIVKPSWVETEIVFDIPGGCRRPIKGWNYARLCVHLSWIEEAETLFVVTHRPTQLAICRFIELADALAFAVRFWGHCGTILSHSGPVDKSKIPASVLAWVRRCEKAKRLVD